MLKKVVTYIDYEDVERTETLMFNLTEAEIAEMELSTSGGLVQKIEKLVETDDRPGIIVIFKDIILKAYGEKSPDGKRFIKSDEISTAFSQTQAYSDLFMQLATDAEAATAFINGIIPKKMTVKPKT